MTASVPASGTIGVRELRQSIAEVLRRVQDGAVMTVTVKGDAVARLTPAPERPPSLFTVAQFDALVQATPESDGRRYELLAGEIVVTPSPTFGHQNLTRLLANLLEQVAPGRVATDWTWQVDDLNKVRPDVLVLPSLPEASAVSTSDLPVVVVEVTSTNRRDDLVTKAALYAAHRVRQYWVLDTRERCLIVHDLDDTTGGWTQTSRIDAGRHVIETPAGPVTVDLGVLAPYLGA